MNLVERLRELASDIASGKDMRHVYVDYELTKAATRIEALEADIALHKDANANLQEIYSEKLEQLAASEKQAIKATAANINLNEQLASAQKQRDELLAAAEQVCQANNFTEARIAVRILNAAIASVKGGA